MQNEYWFWLIFLTTLTLLILLGARITSSWRGLFIDARCKVSLSRLQIIFWTITLMSAIVWFSLQSNVSSVHIPQSLWALLGISGLSAVGSEVIKGTKAAGAEDNGNALLKTLRVSDENKMGLLHKNKKISDARFIDIFKGEELVDHTTVDITKIQMFLITGFVFAVYIFAILGSETQLHACLNGQQPYALDLCQYAAGNEPKDEAGNPLKPGGYTLPALTEGLVALLAISHAGYLSFKATPKTPPHKSLLDDLPCGVMIH